jgi:hypothetical protein
MFAQSELLMGVFVCDGCFSTDVDEISCWDFAKKFGMNLLMDRTIFWEVQTDSGVHPTSYRMGTGGSFPGGKEAGA